MKMALEKILVGDDQVEFAKKVFPLIPGAEKEFVSDPDEVIAKAKTGDYAIIVTDLNYTENGQEGYQVLEALEGVNVRKILWTGNANDEGVRKKAQGLGAEVLNKDEIGTLVGMAKNNAPIKQGGEIMIYVSNDFKSKFWQNAFMEAIEKAGYIVDDVTFCRENLKEELATGKYGLVIDMTTLDECAVVAHDLKYVEIQEIPKVVDFKFLGGHCDLKLIQDHITKTLAEYKK
jgi:hypothetical protein